MTAQRALIVLAVAAGLVAGALYYVGARRVAVVVAAADLQAGRALALTDLDLRELPPDALPAGAITAASAAAGRYLRAPIAKGQLLLADTIGPAPAAFDSGMAVPTGYHAIAIPVNAAQALGGALVPGARVDVIAVPVQGRAPDGRTTELVVPAALVVDVRGDQGGAFERHPSRQPSTAARERIGSVVIAVGPSQELRIADRIATSTFVLALVPERP